MTYIYISIIILLAGVLLWPKGRQRAAGIYKAAADQAVRKRKNKEKILELLGERGELSNSDVREVLGVSAATVTRYMDQLESEGKVKQHGKTGHAVTYSLL